MNATEYRKWCRRFDNHRVNTLPKSLVYGLLSEAGEVAGEFEKADRVDGVLDITAVADELGDVLWNVARLADELGFTLDDLMEQNVQKLIDRHTERETNA